MYSINLNRKCPQIIENCGKISALQSYEFEFYLIGSSYSVYLFCDHRPILFLWSRCGQLSHRLFNYQVVIKFQNLKIIYTEGKNLAFPNLLSRQVPQKEAREFQIEHKATPKYNRFYTSDYNPIKYSKLHCDENKAPPSTSYLLIAHITAQKKIY